MHLIDMLRELCLPECLAGRMRCHEGMLTTLTGRVKSSKSLYMDATEPAPWF